MEQSPFLYYNPEIGQQSSRQHGQFASQPPARKHSCTDKNAVQAVPFPSALVYQSRPSSSHQQTKAGPRGSIGGPAPLLSPAAFSHDAAQRSSGLLTPSSPTLLGMDGPSGGDMYFYPHTPSVPSSENTLISTPVTQSWKTEESCNGTISPAEIQLPPSTPEVWQERSPVSPAYSLPTNHYASGQSSPSLIVSCPSLSPASSEHSSFSEIDFCDPRQLTYPSPHEPEFHLGPVPRIATPEDEHFLLSPDELSIRVEKEIDSWAPEQVPAGTINPAALFGGVNSSKRRDDDDSWDVDNEEFSDVEEDNVLGESSGNSMLMPPSPPPSDLSRRSSVDPPMAKKPKSENGCDDDTDFELDQIIAEARRRGVDEEVCDDGNLLSPFATHSHDAHNLTPAPTELSFCDSDGSQCGELAPAPIVRRGRKQSLTVDPSKTFACHLCTRRFRRQEHLKRHFRSLHTREKPFSCPECGKKFSRSDNLSQHARTHGSATIHMSIVDPEMMAAEGDCMDPNGPLGIVLVDAATVSSGIKEKLTNASAEAKKRRNINKRKRDE